MWPAVLLLGASLLVMSVLIASRVRARHRLPSVDRAAFLASCPEDIDPADWLRLRDLMAEAFGIRPDRLDPGYDLDWLAQHIELFPMVELEDVIEGYCTREDWDRVLDRVTARQPKTVAAFLAEVAWAARD